MTVPPRRAGVFGTSLRRSAALRALPALVAVAVAHVLARSQTWTHEWMWACYQYQFVTVLLGPLLAGVAAWEGVRLARTRDLIGSGNRTMRPIAQSWASVLIWGLVAYTAGAVAVVFLVWRAGTPNAPSLRALATVLPAVCLLAAEAAIGLAAGWWMRHLLAAPVAAVGCFLSTLWMYVVGPSQLVIVGGATSSLISLSPRPTVEAWQVGFFLACALLALVLASRLARWGPRSGRWQAPGAAGLVAVALIGLLPQGDTLLRVVDEPLTCVGTAPSICVAPGYTKQAEAARAALLPFIDAFRSIGVRTPSTFRQNAEPGQRSIGVVDAGLLLGDTHSAGNEVLGSLISKSCPIGSDPALLRQFTGLSAWLYRTAIGEQSADPSAPLIATGPPTAAQRAWLKQAVNTLSSCGR